MSSIIHELRLWYTRDRVYAVPSQITLPRGAREIRCGLHAAFVNPDSLCAYEISPILARELALMKVQGVLRELRDREWMPAGAGDAAQTARRVLEALVTAVPVEGGLERSRIPEDFVDAIHRFAVAARRSALRAQSRIASPPRPVERDFALMEARAELAAALCRNLPVLTQRLSSVLSVLQGMDRHCHTALASGSAR